MNFICFYFLGFQTLHLFLTFLLLENDKALHEREESAEDEKEGLSVCIGSDPRCFGSLEAIMFCQTEHQSTNVFVVNINL